MSSAAKARAFSMALRPFAPSSRKSETQSKQRNGNSVRGERGLDTVAYWSVTLPLLGIGLVLLLATNAFFVLAEFAIVKVRPSRITELATAGDRRAILVGNIQDHLDEYLSVCQVGITLASVALGMVGEKTAEIFMGTDDGNTVRYGVAIGASYLLVSGSHILLGELV